MLGWLCFIIATFLFLLAAFGVGKVFTLETIALGLAFFVFGFVVGGARAVYNQVTNRS